MFFWYTFYTEIYSVFFCVTPDVTQRTFQMVLTNCHTNTCLYKSNITNKKNCWDNRSVKIGQNKLSDTGETSKSRIAVCMLADTKSFVFHFTERNFLSLYEINKMNNKKEFCTVFLVLTAMVLMVTNMKIRIYLVFLYFWIHSTKLFLFLCLDLQISEPYVDIVIHLTQKSVYITTTRHDKII